MRLLRKFRWWLAAGGVLAVAGAAGGLVAWASGQIASPPRQPLLDYHREFLTHPAEHGFKLEAFTASDGTPCLVCEPLADGRTGPRGTAIRQQLAAWRVTVPPPRPVVGTIVLLHGRKGRKEGYLAIAERFCACGLRCVIPDLPAHGDHPLTTATFGIREAEIPALVLTEAAARFGFEPQPAGIFGLSMGGSVAIHAATAPGASWQALTVVASLDTLPAVIEHESAGYVGTALAPALAWATGTAYQWRTGVALAEIQPVRRAAALRVPTLIAHGTADDSVPIACGRHLFEALPATTPKQWLPVPAAGHNNILSTDFPIYAHLAAWFLRHLREPAATSTGFHTPANPTARSAGEVP